MLVERRAGRRYLRTIDSVIVGPSMQNLPASADVSTPEQGFGLRTDLIKAAGSFRVYTDRASGALDDRRSAPSSGTTRVPATPWWSGDLTVSAVGLSQSATPRAARTSQRSTRLGRSTASSSTRPCWSRGPRVQRHCGSVVYIRIPRRMSGWPARAAPSGPYD
jgi:hypothetical protein